MNNKNFSFIQTHQYIIVFYKRKQLFKVSNNIDNYQQLLNMFVSKEAHNG